MTKPIAFEYDRRRASEDGSSEDYGWNVTILFWGQHRIRWNSTRSTTKMWPRINTGADENCNRAITFVMWPLGHLDIWWEPKFRTDEDGICDECERIDHDAFVARSKGKL